jgi:hypothetical protein
MADREIHTYTSGGSSGVGILGVIVGALLVIGAIYFFVGGFGGNGKAGKAPSITINAPQLPATTGSR